MASNFRQAARVSRMRTLGGPSVWLEFSPLAHLTGAINLGQGAPGWSPPPFLTSHLSAAAQTPTYSQYARSAGLPALVEEISRVYTPRLVPPSLRPRRIHPLTEVLVTVGASQALYLACMALLNPGDDAVLIAPAFDIYSGAVALAGATPRYVPLRSRPGCPHPRSSRDLALDMREFETCVSDNTKLLILNSPHNPTGKVFTRDEYQAILAVLEAKAPHCVVISDEVYEHLVFDAEHLPFAAVSPAAFVRTLTIYSAGKTFSATGMKIGWVLGPASLLRDLQLAQQYMVFAVSHASQAAVAHALRAAEEPYQGQPSYYHWLRALYQRKRDLLLAALHRAGMSPIQPDGAFYICATVPPSHGAQTPAGFPDAVAALVAQDKLQIDDATRGRSDYNVCRVLATRYGVAAIPNSAFFPPNMVGNMLLATDCVRFAFCKQDEVLREASEKLCAASTE